jgi:Family of unknown function (DUF5678)
MLGDAWAFPMTPPPVTAWPPGSPAVLGLGGGAWLQSSLADPLALDREALVASFSRRASVAVFGLGQESYPGQLLTFRSRDQHGRPPPLRSRELSWRRAHEQKLREFVGQWVIVEGEELIAHGPDPAPLVAAARARGIRIPYIFFVEPSGENTVRLGL